MLRKISLFLTVIFLLVNAINIFAQPQSCVQPPSQMVAWFPFDENSGNTTANLITGGNPGTLMNNPTWVAGPGQKVLNSLNFDGVNDFVQVADQPQLNFGTGDFSIDAWIRVNPQSSGIRTIVEKRVNSTSVQGYLFFYNGNNNSLNLQLADGTHTNYGVLLPSSPVGGWQHVAVTVQRNSSTGMKFYYGGIPLTPSLDPRGRMGSLTNTAPLRIGSQNGAVFNGGIDEVELFNRVLTAEEVRSIAQAGSFGKCKRNCCGEGENLVQNGNFNQGNNLFQSSYSSQFTNFLPGNYWVGNSTWASGQCENWRINGHTNCGNPQDNFLLINGMTNNPNANNQSVWSQTVNVPMSQREETYYFCAWFKDLKQCCFNRQPQISMQARAGANNSNQNATISAGSQVCDWQLVSTEIKVPAGTTTASLQIRLDGTVLGDGNDLAIDDISLRKAPVTTSVSGNIATSDATPGKYNITGTGGAVTNQTCRTYWEVVEIVNGNPVPTTLMTWATNTTTFSSFGGGSTAGIFDYAKTYRLRYYTECDCAKDGPKFKQWVINGDAQLKKVNVTESVVSGSSKN